MPDAGASPKRPGLPATIGRYRIVERVGRGAMGVVYAAQDDEMGRPVAIKVLMGDLEHDPDSRARFYREAQAAAGLLHPNIITIYDAGEDQGRSYIAMQLLEGWPLASYVKRPEAAPLERKLDLITQLCDGLAAAHARGIVHRDLKPGNLFVQSDGLLKILDFGVARLADSRMTATGMMLGTPDYMSPEQARGAQVDTRSDIFSAGAVLYFMLAGRKPFPGPDLPAILRQLQFDAPAALPPAVPADLARLVMQAMAKDPADRPSRIQELHTAIVRFRRAYDAETRRLVADVQARYAAAADAETAIVGAARRLDLSPGYQPSATLVELRETWPGLVDPRAARDSAAPDRASVERVLEQIEAEQHRLEEEARRQTAWVQAAEAAERLLEDGDARQALQQLEPLGDVRVVSRRLQRLLARAEPAAAEQARIDAHVETLAGAAREAIADEAWDRARAAIDDALELRPQSEALRALHEQAAAGAARERQRRHDAAAAARARADAAIRGERFDVAAAALDEAEAHAGSDDDTAALREQLAAARSAAAARAELRRQAEETIRAAHRRFGRGDYRDGVELLAAFAREHPQAEGIPAEQERLQRLHERIEQAVRMRRAESVRLAAAARAREAQGALEEAIAHAGEAVRADGSDEAAVRLLDELIERDRAQRVQAAGEAAARTRGAAAAHLIADARALQARGFTGEAVRLASSAVALVPGSGEAAQLLEELQRALASDDQEPISMEEAPFPAADPPPVPPPSSPPTAREVRLPQAAAADGGVLGQVQGWLRRRRNPGA